MSSQTDTSAEEALLMELAQLGMGVARQLHQAVLATTDAVRLLALVTAYSQVSRGVRQSLALRARFAAGTVAPRQAIRAEAPTPEPRPEVERADWNEYERPDWHTRLPALAEGGPLDPESAEAEACRVRIRRDLTVVSRSPTLSAIPALQPYAAALAGRAALLGGASALRLVDTS